MNEGLHVDITADNKQYIASFKQAQQSAFNLKEDLLKYQSLAFTEKDNAKVQAYNRRIQELQVSLKQMGNAGKEGFDAMGNAVEKAGNPLTKAYSGIRKIAYILPGIGIAGIFNLAFEAIGKAANELGLFINKEDEAKKSLAEYNKELSKNVQSGAEEISKLRALEDAASNNSLSLKQRMHAVRELRDEYPGYFKDLTNEQILTGDITKATDSLTQAIYKRAEARAREADIAKKATQIFENQQTLEKIDADLIKTRANKDKGGVSVGGGTLGGISGSSDAGFERTLNKEADLLKQKDKLLTENSTLQLQIVGSQLKINALTAETIDLDKKDISVKKQKEDEYVKLLDTLAHIQAEYGKRIIDNTEYNKKSIAAIDEATKHLKLHSDEYKKAIALLDEFYRVQKEKGGLAATVSFEDAKASEIDKELQKKKEDEKVFGKFDAPKNIKDSGKNGSGVFDADIEKFGEKKKQSADEFNEKLKITQQLAFGIGDAFSKAIESGQNLGDTLKAVFADLAKQIEKALIKALLLKAIGGLFGLEGLGSVSDIFKNILGGGKGFASGGLSTGPQGGHMELLHGNEWVLRPEQLSGSLNVARKAGIAEGAGQGVQSDNGLSKEIGQLRSAVAQLANQPVQLLPFIKGADLNILINRVQQQNQRSY